MRKVIGIGETILDIIFEDNKPSTAIPGGSVFNGMVSLARSGVKVCFISETGNDHVGNIILQFMRDNGMPTDYVNVFPDGKSPVALAFLNERNDAEYLFYKDYPAQRLDVDFPTIEEDDIVIFGSYFALNPVLRSKVVDLLEEAKHKNAIIYYDPNFRATHKGEAMRLTAPIIENFEYATIVRGSADDFENLYGLTDREKIYKDKVKFYCPNFIFTAGGSEVSLFTRQFAKNYPTPQIDAVSTVGAGDNFNAGILFGLLKNGIRYRDIETLDEQQWDKIIASGMAFATEACKSLNNYISTDFAKSL